MAFTYFFRDAPTLQTAIAEALPGLQGRAFIHVWDAGCAHGPEPYTLAILLRERMSEYAFRNVRIHATDVDPCFAPQVASGVFAAHEVTRVPPEIRRKYFQPAAGRRAVEIVPELRTKVTFARHDLLTQEPIREGLSLIVCKNVLLHFDEAQRVGVLRMFHRAFQRGGILVMEHTQKLPAALAGDFRRLCPDAQVYGRANDLRCDSAEERGRHRHGAAPDSAAAPSRWRPDVARTR